jgi:hypothetical protein
VEPPDTGGLGAQRILGIGLAGVGVVGLGVGTYFALHAKARLDDSNAHCALGNVCDASGLDARSDAVRSANLATISFVAGLGALAGGAIIYLTAPSAKARVGVVPSLSPACASLAVRAAFE